MAHVKELKFAIDCQNTDDGVKQLLAEIKPSWKWDNTGQKLLSGGHSSVMIRCYNKTSPNDSVTIRIRNLITGNEQQQNFEMKMLKHFSKAGYVPFLLATFSNGYCYQYIEGVPMLNASEQSLTISEVALKDIATKMVHFHSAKPEGVEFKDSQIFAMFSNIIANSMYQPLTSNCPSKETLLNECKILKKLFDELNTPLAIAHGDCHPGNMIWNESTKTVTIVDWELVHVGYEYADIAFFISVDEDYGRENMKDFVLSCNFNVPENMPEEFCKLYYNEWCQIHNKEFAQREFDAFRSNIRKFETLQVFELLMCGTLVMNEKSDNVKFDIIKFVERNAQLYLRLKQQHFGINTFG